MLWLEVAWGEIGVKEIVGPDAQSNILAYFSEVGRDDILSDEVAWCMAFYLACLLRAGVPIDLPKEERLLARAALKIGQPIDEPCVGCCAVFRRGDSDWQAHVGFVTAWTPTHLQVLGGNQANSVTTTWYDRDRLLGLRWPAPAATARDLKEAGSRTVIKSAEAKRDGMLSALYEAASNVVNVTQKADETKTALETGHALTKTLVSFSEYAYSKLPLILTVVALYFLARMMWNMGWVTYARVQDHNSGAHTGREVETEAESDVGKIW